jgi:hypothetical protein
MRNSAHAPTRLKLHSIEFHSGNGIREELEDRDQSISSLLKRDVALFDKLANCSRLLKEFLDADLKGACHTH